MPQLIIIQIKNELEMQVKKIWHEERKQIVKDSRTVSAGLNWH